jgi:hypothetical protein
MQPFPKSKPKSSKKFKPSSNFSLAPALLIVAVVGLVSLLANLNLPTKSSPTVAGAVVTIESSTSGESKNQEHNQPQSQQQPEEQKEQDSTLKAYWGSPTSQAQFWFDGRPVAATCDQHNCTVTKPKGAKQVYLRWFDIAENRWYYFQANSEYKGQFKGIPLNS